MTAVNKVAIAGCGVAGMAAAIALAKAGVHVDIFESKPELSALGSGITLQGNALRALDQIGVWQDLLPLGAAVDGLTLRLPGPGAPILQQLPEMKNGGPDYPGTFGVYRPELAGVLLSHTLAAGTTVRFGASVTRVEVTGDGVEVFVDDVSVGVYDLLI